MAKSPIGTLELMQNKIERYEIALKEIASREGDFYEDEVASIAKESLEEKEQNWLDNGGYKTQNEALKNSFGIVNEVEMYELDDSFKPKTELGKTMKMMVENGDHCDGNIYYLIWLLEKGYEDIEILTKQNEKLNEKLKKANQARYNLGEGM